MSCQAFGARQNLHIVGKVVEALARDRLRADAFHEISRAETATASSPAAGGEDMVAATGVIAERLRGVSTQENRAGRGAAFQEVALRAMGRRQAEMFGRKAIDEVASFAQRACDEDGSCTLYGGVRGIVAW